MGGLGEDVTRQRRARDTKLSLQTSYPLASLPLLTGFLSLFTAVVWTLSDICDSLSHNLSLSVHLSISLSLCVSHSL